MLLQSPTKCDQTRSNALKLRALKENKVVKICLNRFQRPTLVDVPSQ